jgi:hypothetical protein
MTSNLILTQGEQILSERDVCINPLFFWVKAHYTLTNKRLIQHAPNLIAGIIPFGKSEVSQPLNSVSTVRLSTEMKLGILIAGILSLLIMCLPIILFGFVVMISSLLGFIFGLIIILFGILLSILVVAETLMFYTVTFTVEGSGGHTGRMYKYWFKEKDNLELLCSEVNSLLANKTTI